jgi:hypothetical protein
MSSSVPSNAIRMTPFEPTDGFDLCFCRILYCTLLCWMFLPRDFTVWGDIPDVFWDPIWLFDRAGLGPPSTHALAWSQLIWKSSLVLSAIGVCTRLSLAIGALIGVFLLGTQHCFGKVDHIDAVVPIVLGVLCVSRCGDYLSVDRRAGWAKGLGRSGEYRWPLWTIWLLYGLVFLGAGISKLRYGGLDWGRDGEIQALLLSHAGSLGGEPWVNWGPVIAGYPRICSAIGSATLACECMVIVAVIWPTVWTRLVAAAVGMALLLAFPMLMGPIFVPLMATTLFLIPWHSLLARVGGEGFLGNLEASGNSGGASRESCVVEGR